MPTTCDICGKRGATDLCMGCGAHIHAKCAVEVRGVKYCPKCEETAREFEETVSNPSFSPDAEDSGATRKYQAFDTTEEGKWEKSFDSSSMVEVTKKDLKEKATAIDLTEAYAGFGRRLVAHLLDIALALFPGVVVGFVILRDTESPLTRDIYPLFFDQFMANMVVTLIVAYVVLFAERVILNSFGGVTLGRLFVGLKVVSTDGTPAGIVRGTFRAILSTILDLLVVVGWLAYLFTALGNKKGQAIHDMMAGTCVVSGGEWKQACTNALMAGAKKEAAVTPPKGSSPKTAPPPDYVNKRAETSPTPTKDDKAGAAAPGKTPPQEEQQPKPQEDLPAEDEILSPFATYDDAYEPAAPEERDPDAFGQDDGKSDEGDDDEHSTDIRDPWNS